MELTLTEPSERRKCKRPARPMADGFRPSDMLAAFFVAAAAYMVAGLLLFATQAAGLLEWEMARWAGLHLIFVGGVSQLIIGASQFFAGAFLASGPPPRKLVRRQIACWNVAALLVLAGVAGGITPLVDLGEVFVLGGLGLFAYGLHDLRKRSLQTRPWATRWFMASAFAFAVGSMLGVLLAHDVSLGHDVLGPHITLNVAGWMGIAIVGTLHTFFPSLTETMLRFPRLEPITFWTWCGGIALVALGLCLGQDVIVGAGIGSMVVAAGMLLLNLIGSVKAAARFKLQPRLLLAGHISLLVALVVVLVQTFGGSLADLSWDERKAVGTLLVGGWVGMTVIGSLLHLVPILVRVRDLTAPPPPPPPAWTLALAPIGLLAVLWRAAGVLSDAAWLSRSGAAALVVVYVLLCGLVLVEYRRLARGHVVELLALREKPPRIL